MAFTLLRVLVLGVIAAATDDVSITWSSSSRAALPCVLPDAEKLVPRRPPPPLDAEDKIKSKPFVWRRDNEEIKRVPWNGTLEVLKRKDGSSEGVYQCAVKHHGGFVLGYPVHLRFAYIDKQFTVDPGNSTAYTGQPFVLSCEINSGPPAVITWQKDNEPLPQNSRYHVLNNQLLIKEVTKEDAGVYRCKATNVYVNKTRYSQSGSLHVEDYNGDIEVTLLPIKTDHSIYVTRGSRVVLPCPVTGWPKPKLIWELTPPDGRTGELEAVDHILVLTNIEYDQEGVYTCTVEGNSDLTMNYNVTIKEPVSITLPPMSKLAVRASLVRFNCTAVGRPTATVTWYKDGQPLLLTGRIVVLSSVDGKRRELLIRSVTSNDAGVYQCMARSGPELTSAWGLLEVRGAEAAAPRRGWCEPLSASTVRVRWPSLSDVVAYTVQTTRPGGTSFPGQPVNKTEDDITVEVPLTPYEFQVRAFIRLSKINKTIASDFSKTITCSGQGVPVKLDKIGDDAILVSWKKFHDQNPGVVQWILQYRNENSTEEHNVTLDGSVFNYSLKVSPGKAVQVRVLGSRSQEWLQQNLTLVPWTSSNSASSHDTGYMNAIAPVPEELEAIEVGPREFRLRWRCSEADLQPDAYSYMVCTRMMNRNEDCIESYVTSVIIDNLQPNTEYEVRVQARLSGGSSAGHFSSPLRVRTQHEEAKSVEWEWVGEEVLVSWENGEGGVTRLVRYSQNLTHSLETWPAINVTGTSVMISGLNPTQLTYVMVSAPGPSQRSQVITVQPRQPPTNSKLYIGVGVGSGVLFLCVMAAAAAVYIWRRKKRSRSPIRARRRRASSGVGDDEEYAEMKSVGGRLANGASTKEVGEPLLNGHVHITENPTSKTPNGKLRKGRKQEAMFDVSRYEEPDTVTESEAGETSGVTAYTLLDTSRPPDPDRPDAKLPDDNMNSESNPAQLEHQPGCFQPTLQPNG